MKKRILFALLSFVMFVVFGLFDKPSMAADVTLQITIRDVGDPSRVQRVLAAINGGAIFCGLPLPLTPIQAKQCLIQRIEEDIRGFTINYERKIAREAADSSVQDLPIEGQ